MTPWPWPIRAAELSAGLALGVAGCALLVAGGVTRALGAHVRELGIGLQVGRGGAR